MQSFGFLRLLGKVYVVIAWLGVAGGTIALFTSQIFDKTRTEGPIMYPHVVTEPGIGVSGVASILAATAIHFVLFMGLSQMINLWLSLDEKVVSAGRRLAEVSVTLSEMNATQRKTAEHVRKVGEIVYEEAQK